MAIYIYQIPGWPKLKWDQDTLASLLARVWYEQGRLIGRMEGLDFRLQAEATLQTLTLDVLKSSEIEGEALNDDQVRCSLLPEG